MSKKALFYFLKTGNGHLAPARAIAEKLTETSSESIEPELIDGLDNASFIAKEIIENGYRKTIIKAKFIFEFLYLLHKIELISRISVFLVSLFVLKNIERSILEKKPQKIIILHFFLIHPILKILKKHNLSIPTITVVTDPYTAHPIWFLNKQQNFIVFSNLLKNKMIDKNKINPCNITVFPFVLRDCYSKTQSQLEVISSKLEFGIDLNKKVLLILGGGDGMPKSSAILKKLIAANLNIEIIIVCGRNKILYNKVEKLKQNQNITNLKIFGYVDFIHRLISISDAVLTKCGASTFMEILLMNKIPIINNYIWEQELGNMQFVRDNNLGIYEKNINRIPELVKKLFTNELYYLEYKENITSADLKNGTDKVANYILSFQ